MTEFGTFDMEMLGITQDQIKEVDSSEAEVVSRVLMSRIKDITATIRPDGITFNATCVRSMVGVIYIQMYIDRGNDGDGSGNDNNCRKGSKEYLSVCLQLVTDGSPEQSTGKTGNHIYCQQGT